MSRALTDPCQGISVVFTSTKPEVLDHAELKGANVAVISCTLAEEHMSGLNLLKRLTASDRGLNCLLVVDQDERHLVTEAFRAGAVGVIQRDQPYEQLLKCITCVHNGQVWASSQQMRYALEALASGLQDAPPVIAGPSLLSKREEQIVAKVAEGLKNREIAKLLYVSEHTIKNHLFRIFGRLGISSRAELILYAHGRRISMQDPAEASLRSQRRG
jgi:DNA-binding NarL/FixJ family response regulator